MEKLEEEARKEKRGLWQDENPIPPWEGRKRERENKVRKGNEGEKKILSIDRFLNFR